MTSNPGELDNDPDLLQTSENESHDVDSEVTARDHRARVRFNSNAAVRRPRERHNLSSTANHTRTSATPRPPPILRGHSRDTLTRTGNDDEDPAAAVWEESTTISRDSFDSIAGTELDGSDSQQLLKEDHGIPLQDLNHTQHQQHQHPTGRHLHDDFEQSPSANSQYGVPGSQEKKAGHNGVDAAEGSSNKQPKNELDEIYNASYDGSYDVPQPEHFRGGVLSQLLKLYKHSDLQAGHLPQRNSRSPRASDHKQVPSSTGTGSTTPERRKWYEQNNSRETLATLVGASTNLAKPAQPQGDSKRPRLQHKRGSSGIVNRLSALLHREEVYIKEHIAGTLARHEFILKLCRALMLYGAPTHRLEEYLTMTARSLEIEAQFLYIPGCMIISFDDIETHTTAVKLVRLAQGIDLGRLKDVHRIYKEVLHDVIGVEEATGHLDELMAKRAKFHPWLRVLVFGVTSVTAAPFSFHARLIDLPLCFLFGCLVGSLQLIVAPISPLYSNVLEVTATVFVSFLARAFGSIRGGDLFCFSALAQGGIVMLLPGYTFLSSSLELQARAIVPGSIRIVYGIIYCLLLGFGITVGSALYGLMDTNATSNLTCSNPIPSYYTFTFVPFFVLCISILYQSKWKQMPIMVLVACAGYIVNYFSSLRFPTSPQIASGFGAFAVGTLANLYSRFRHGVAAAILVPAIFTQVPGGLASNGGLLSGLEVANEINNNTKPVNGTTISAMDPNYVVFNVASSMIQIAIGITVGLFMSALVVYPLGKRRSGLFSF